MEFPDLNFRAQHWIFVNLYIRFQPIWRLHRGLQYQCKFLYVQFVGHFGCDTAAAVAAVLHG